MRTALLLVLAGVVGCGASQAVPAVVATPTSGIVATQPAIEVALANALVGAPINPAAPPDDLQVVITGSPGFDGTYVLHKYGIDTTYPLMQVYTLQMPGGGQMWARVEHFTPADTSVLQFSYGVPPVLDIGIIRPAQDGTFPLKGGGTATITPL